MPNTRSANWRSYVNVHPAADLFPLLPPEELAGMTERIKANGIQVPLAFYTDEQGKVWLLDGRNRLDALAASGYDVEAFLKSKPSRLNYRAPNDDPEEVVVRLNIFRRHLTQEQRRDLVAKLLKVTPERSNTDTARLALVDPKTVSSVRRREEAKGKIPRMDKTVAETAEREPRPPRHGRRDLRPRSRRRCQSRHPLPKAIKMSWRLPGCWAKIWLRACRTWLRSSVTIPGEWSASPTPRGKSWYKAGLRRLVRLTRTSQTSMNWSWQPPARKSCDWRRGSQSWKQSWLRRPSLSPRSTRPRSGPPGARVARPRRTRRSRPSMG